MCRLTELVANDALSMVMPRMLPAMIGTVKFLGRKEVSIDMEISKGVLFLTELDDFIQTGFCQYQRH